MMDSQSLKMYADAFLEGNFDMPLDIPIRISKRMKSRLGAFQIKCRYNEVVKREIVISHEFIKHNDEDTILDVLYHECVYYRLYAHGQLSRDTCSFFINRL